MTSLNAQGLEAAARAEAEFDGRGWLEMPRTERERYKERLAAAVAAYLASAWQPEAPPNGVTAEVDCGGCYMTILNPYQDVSVEWALRYGNADQMKYVAASLISSYDYLLSGNINLTEATRRLRRMRAARRDLRDKAASPLPAAPGA